MPQPISSLHSIAAGSASRAPELLQPVLLERTMPDHRREPALYGS